MATRIESDIFETHARTKYPWAEWTDGSTWQIETPEDFSCSVASMKGHLYSHAFKSDLKVNVRQTNETTLVFRFFPLPTTEG